jgi:hypothetical protein
VSAKAKRLERIARPEGMRPNLNREGGWGSFWTPTM